jgi:trans-aconitate 2-methyltransferase
MDWDPMQYLRYGDERLRPFVELVGRVGAHNPHHVVDLGCGPGNATVLLAERWPSAEVVGVDSSTEMIDGARSGAVRERVRFEIGDAAEFRPSGALDVLISNATLQWVPGHLGYFEAYVGALADDGWFAFQVPAMHEAPSHRMLYDLAREPRYGDRLEPLVRDNSIESAEAYFAALEALGCAVDLWETTYFHILPGDDAVYEWTRGSSLRPFADALSGDEREEFLAEYRARLRSLYPSGPSGTIYPFRRRFVVAHRGAR